MDWIEGHWPEDTFKILEADFDGATLRYGEPWRETVDEVDEDIEPFCPESDETAASRAALVRGMRHLCGFYWGEGLGQRSLLDTAELLDRHLCTRIQRYSLGELRAALEEKAMVLLYLPSARIALLERGCLPTAATRNHAVEALELTDDTLFVRDDLRPDGARFPLPLQTLDRLREEIWMLELMK